MTWSNAGWQSDQGGWYKKKSAASAFSALINFRDTAGFVTDGSGQTYCLSTDVYPTTRAGLTFGWESGSLSSADRDNTLDPRLAGVNYVFGASGTFRLDLPSAGNFSCDMASGDTFSQSGQVESFIDGATTLQTIASHSTAASHWVDINGTDFNGAPAWVSGHVPMLLSFATTIFRFNLDGVAGTISHLSVTR